MMFFGRGNGFFVRQDTSEASELGALRSHVANLAMLVSSAFGVCLVVIVLVGRWIIPTLELAITARVLRYVDDSSTIRQRNVRAVIAFLTVLIFVLSAPLIFQAWPPIWYRVACYEKQCYNLVGIGNTPGTALWIKLPVWFLFFRMFFAASIFFSFMLPAFIMARRNIQSAQFPYLDTIRPDGKGVNYVPYSITDSGSLLSKLFNLVRPDDGRRDERREEFAREREPVTVEVVNRGGGGARINYVDAPVPRGVFERFLQYVARGGDVSERAIVSARVMTQRQWRALAPWLIDNGLARWRNDADHRQGIIVNFGGWNDDE